MMGADVYERPDDFIRNREKNRPDIGVGPGCHIRQAIIDKNARIGANCRLSPAGLAEKTETDAWYVRDSILVVKKNAIIAPGTVVGE
jgi:glucose-1-phosphate adenylyltransferase